MIFIKNNEGRGEVFLEDGKFISNKFNVRVIDKIKFICNDCGKEVQKEIRKFKKPITIDSLLCGPCVRKMFYLKEYGVENPQQIKKIRDKTLKTMNERYGGNAPLCSKKIKEKIKETNIEKYGVENVFQNKKIKEKIKETNIEKYGVENSMQSSIVKEKAKKNRLLKFYNNIDKRTNCLVTPLFNVEESKFIASNRENKVLWKCNKCENEFYDHMYSGRIPICKKCFPPSYLGESNKELEIKEFIESLGFKTEKFYYKDYNNGRPKEIDIFISEKNIAIEFDGLYWHSESKLSSGRKNSSKKYHLEKTEKCEENNIRLIHIFEDEWTYKKEIVENRLKSIFGIYENRIGGRETIIKEIDIKTKNSFLNKFHIQGEDKSTVKLGAFKGDKLISVMTFCKPRIAMGQKNIESNVYELSRFVSISNTLVPGVASKLLKYFIRKYSPKKIYTYSDKRWNTGNLYKQLNFNYIGETGANYWYIINGIRFHRFKYRKQQLPSLLENFDPNLTEYQNMLDNGYDRIWDCGNDKWELTL